MANLMQTSLMIRKESIYDKIRKKLFILICGKDYQMIQQLDELMKPKRPQKSKIIIPKEIGKDLSNNEKYKRL